MNIENMPRYTESKGEGMPNEKERVWNQSRAAVENIKDKLGKGVDEHIKESVTAFLVHGLPTAGSCEGHPEKKERSFPWVDICTPPPEGWQNDKTKQEQWRKENLAHRQKLINILHEFYADRHVLPEIKLALHNKGIYGSVRIQSTDTNILSILPDEERKEKYSVYFREMEAFTAFLKEKYFSS